MSPCQRLSCVNVVVSCELCLQGRRLEKVAPWTATARQPILTATLTASAIPGMRMMAIMHAQVSATV